ncbi:S8 family serine peptidase [Xylanimonas allomyrinae]|uniref:S8 family serine peptidase n=1 Tax=Xylanimonas allomyrinae TaxID=2509459 RepID=UPI0013A66F03|nr:S8 family serine peptidase [Xylanimonas allomyrinae]
MNRSLKGVGRAGVKACAAVVVAGVVVVGGRAAAWGVDGSWWYGSYGVAEVNAQGADGHGVTVAVIDDGINPQVPMLADADLVVHEPSFCLNEADDAPAAAASTDFFESGHGTNVVAHLVGNGQGYDGQSSVRGISPKARVRFYDDNGYYSPNPDGSYNPGILCGSVNDADATAAAVVQAVDDGADIISISQETITVSGDDLSVAFAYAMHEGVIVVHGMSNDGVANQRVNGGVAVQAVGPDLKPATPTARIRDIAHQRVVMAAGGQMLVQGDPTTGDWRSLEIAGGSSFATPLVAGMLADVWSVYPDATANQLLQSLIRNTGSEDHELGYDEIFGYGLASVGHMVRAGDPAQYPDQNPLIELRSVDPERSEPSPTAEEIAAGVRPSWAPALAADPSTDPSGKTSGKASGDGSGGAPAGQAPAGAAGWGVGRWVLVGGLGVVGLVLVAGVVTVVVVLTRRGRTVPRPAVPVPGAGVPPQAWPQPPGPPTQGPPIPVPPAQGPSWHAPPGAQGDSTQQAQEQQRGERR